MKKDKIMQGVIESFIKRNFMITTNLGIVLIEGKTSLTDEELLEMFDKERFGIFVYDVKGVRRLDLE